MSPQLDTVEQVNPSPSPADGLAGIIVAAAAVGFGAVGILIGEILALAFCALLGRFVDRLPHGGPSGQTVACR